MSYREPWIPPTPKLPFNKQSFWNKFHKVQFLSTTAGTFIGCGIGNMLMNKPVGLWLFGFGSLVLIGTVTICFLLTWFEK